MSNEAEKPRPAWVMPARLALGLAQGVALYLLYRAQDTRGWPAGEPLLFSPLLMAAAFVPLLVSQALGTMRPRTLLAWAAVATAITLWAGFYDRLRSQPYVAAEGISRILPDFPTVLFAFAGLFIAQCLVAAADADRRVIARYQAYFDAAWKLGLQAAFAVAFAGAFWIVLWLGAELFELIRLDFLQTLIRHEWFSIPATTLSIAAAVELTDVRARLIAGIRGVALTLLGWLLPVMTLIAAGFLLTLFFTGLAPLWATKEAAGGLLTAAAALVVLVNAAYQDGNARRPALLRGSEMVAALVLTPLALLTAYAVWLRVGQYGWTVARLATLDCLIVAAVYAGGYGAAAALAIVRPGRMPILERGNVVAAILALALLGSWFTPFTDPAKLSVDDQIGRLRSGAVTPGNFDFYYLAQEGGRYGARALDKLAKLKGDDTRTSLIRGRARAVLRLDTPTTPPAKPDLARSLTVHPAGAVLPRSFVTQNWAGLQAQLAVPACLTMAGQMDCDAVMADLDGDGTDEIIVINGHDEYFWGTVMKLDAKGQWLPVANLPGLHCKGDYQALIAGTYKVAAPPPPALRDIVVGGHRVPYLLPQTDKLDCTP
ncbi:MAG: DUF4153 domain-containing protein [Rhizomicrobium sp.]